MMNGEKSEGKLTRLVVTLIIACGFLQAAPQAWNDTGHRLVALVAYERLDETTRTAIVEVIKRHERFDADFRGKMPQNVRNADQATQNRWIFLQAAIWPDIDQEHHVRWCLSLFSSFKADR